MEGLVRDPKGETLFANSHLLECTVFCYLSLDNEQSAGMFFLQSLSFCGCYLATTIKSVLKKPGYCSHTLEFVLNTPHCGNGFSLNHGWGIYGVRRKITVAG